MGGVMGGCGSGPGVGLGRGGETGGREGGGSPTGGPGLSIKSGSEIGELGIYASMRGRKPRVSSGGNSRFHHTTVK